MLGYGMLVGSRQAWLHAISAGAIAVLIGFSLVVLLDLSFPFSGDFAIEPAPIRDRRPCAVLRPVEGHSSNRMEYSPAGTVVTD